MNNVTIIHHLLCKGYSNATVVVLSIVDFCFCFVLLTALDLSKLNVSTYSQLFFNLIFNFSRDEYFSDSLSGIFSLEVTGNHLAM